MQIERHQFFGHSIFDHVRFSIHIYIGYDVRSLYFRSARAPIV